MSKWYKTGFKDGQAGLYDPPWQPGHRDHTNYCEGYVDGQRQSETLEDALVEAADYVGKRRASK